jgi:superfamily II DNA or RNA helicase
MILRDYQEDLWQKIRLAVGRKEVGGRGRRAIVVRAPTGAGKTVIFAKMAATAEAKNNRTSIYMPRRELVFQTQEKIARYGVKPGVIMSGEPLNLHRLIQVCSFDTINARAIKRDKMSIPFAHLVIPDEAHLSTTESRLKILQKHKDDGARIVSFTATPARTDGFPLGRVYDELVEGWTTKQMIEAGYLVRPRYVVPTDVDLAHLKINPKTGDYVEEELEAEFDRPRYIGEIVDCWMEHARGMSTITFGITQKHARHILERYLAAGVRAEYVDADTPKSERIGIFQRIQSGETTVLVNVFVATYGIDLPKVRCIQLARATKSLVTYQQIGGRGLRPLWDREYGTPEERLAYIAQSEKPDMLLLDHVGAVAHNGFLEDDIPWTIDDDGRTVSERKRAVEEEKQAPKELVCPACRTAFAGMRNCPACGYELLKPSQPVPHRKAQLVEIVDTGSAANRKTSWEEKAQFYGEAKGYCMNKGFNVGFAAHKYREKFGVWPNDIRVRDTPAREPTTMFMNFMKYLGIRRAKGKETERRAG